MDDPNLKTLRSVNIKQVCTTVYATTWPSVSSILGHNHQTVYVKISPEYASGVEQLVQT